MFRSTLSLVNYSEIKKSEMIYWELAAERRNFMKLTTKGRYGLRAVIDLAMYAKEEPVSLAEVAERQSISISYLEQLVAKLKKAGIVQSTRGAQGGYALAKEPEEISVGEILRALEGSLSPVDCSAVDGEGPSYMLLRQCRIFR